MEYRKIGFGDSAIILKAGDDISTNTNNVVRKMLRFFERHRFDGILDYIPSYNELLISYDPSVTNRESILNSLHLLENEIDSIILPESRTICIPVLYGETGGPDLREVAGYNSISEDEVIRIHSDMEYYVYMLGFTPGFCYLGGIDERIVTPRKTTPRLTIPAGSVGIAGNQTGIYPIDSPGGWQIIGNTPVKLFDPLKSPEFLVNAGDFIKFCPVGRREYLEIEKKVNTGTWKAEIINKSS